MAINFFDLYNKLSEKYNVKNFKCEHIEEVLDIKLVTKSQKEFNKQILFIGNSSDIDLTLSLKGAYFILIENDLEKTSKLLEQSIDVILLSDEEDLFSIFNDIKDIFTNELQMMKSSAILLNSLIQGKGLNYLINLASKILDNPIILIDSSFKVISNSSNHEITDVLWKDNIEMGYCSYEFIAEVKKLKSVRNSPKTNTPYIVTCSESPIRRLVNKVFINNKKVGYILMLESNTPISDKHWNLLSIISNVVSEKLQDNHLFNNTKGNIYEYFLLELLEESIKDENTKLERLKIVDLNYENSIYIFNIDLSNYKSNHSPDYLRNSLESLVPNARSIFYHEHIVLLAESNKDNYFSNKTIESFTSFLNKEGLLVGMSTGFDYILDFRNYYLQAFNALQLGKNLGLKGPIFFYENLRFYDLLNQVPNQANLLKYCHPKVITLKKYDEKNKTNYFETLYYYLKYNGNINLTAEKLFIHRNTMGYRMQKIEDILEMDLKDGENIFQLNYSIRILTMMN